MKSEDFSQEELSQAMTPQPQQNVEMSPLAELAKDTDKDVIDGNYWPIDELPSKFKLYPTGTKIFARPLKVLEVKMLSSLTNDNFHHVITEVLKKSVRGIEIDKLLVSDKLFIIFWLRANTYKNSGYTVDFDCNMCDTHSTYEFEIDNLDIIDIKDDYNPNDTLKLPQCGDELTTRQLTIAEENNVKNFQTRNRRSLTEFDEDILTIANLIKTINGKEESLMYKYDYIVSMNPIDFGKIESYLNHFDMGISPIMNVTCKNCGGIADVAVSFRPEFFVPKAGLD
jgi:hypothetical protein|tara:strand:- start:879 stop:1727 length:849 start_codon:yes stop_codon:yes gene_type:complete